MAKWLKYRTGDREISIRAFIRRKGRFRERFDFHSLPPLRFPPADKTRSHEKNLGSSLVYKIPKFRSPLLPVNFPERDPLGFSCKNRGTVQEKTNSETRNFWNSTTPRWFLFSLSLPFFLLCTFTYDLQKERKKEKKNCFDYSAKSFRQNIFLDTTDAWFPPSFERDSRSRGRATKETVERVDVQVHPTDLNSWPERFLCFSTPTWIHILRGCLELFLCRVIIF